MADSQPWKIKGIKKEEWLAKEVAEAVGAGRTWNCETVDFSDPNRPPTCIEVDFPIIPINQIAAIEGNAGKPIYQMSKWWARRRSSVFRAMLLASAIKAPDDPSEAAKLVWEAYYGNHQRKGAFKDLKVADIFMGGGTTVVEGSRLGMQMHGIDLNPVAWFVVKNELAQVDRAEVEALLADIEAEVKPQIMPYYACNCPRGHKGEWTQLSTGKLMGDDFDPLALRSEERKNYGYQGPEIIYTFWGKHGPCQVTGCGHRTPVMNSPVMAIKTLTVRSWSRSCKNCGSSYDLEERSARMAPGVSLVVAETERPYAVARLNRYDGSPESAVCPSCGEMEALGSLGKGQRKKIEFSLLVHSRWLEGEKSHDETGQPLGGSAEDPAEGTYRWDQLRAEKCRLIEVRGKLPSEITCPDTGQIIKTDQSGGTIPKRGHFVCSSCGTVQNLLDSVKAFGKTAPWGAYAHHCFCPTCAAEKEAYGGRYFVEHSRPEVDFAAGREWQKIGLVDPKYKWPQSKIPIGAEIGPHDVEGHHFRFWHLMFNKLQLMSLSRILGAIEIAGEHDWETREYVLGGFQQYLRNQNMFCFWDIGYDKLVPFMSGSNFHPKANVVANGVFSKLGRGNWRTCSELLIQTCDFSANPWEIVKNDDLASRAPYLKQILSGKSTKVYPQDRIQPAADISCESATDIGAVSDGSLDLIITDPPFSGLVQYAEISDFFYVWLRLALRERYPDMFSLDFTPKTLEAVANRARNPEGPEAHYKRLLTEAWRQAGLKLKASGLLSFTFHHSEDAPWVTVLESLFDAGFYLVATFPIRGDETKGQGQFGAQKVEYDIIHVCRRRQGGPSPISWAKLRRQVLHDVRNLQELLEHHQEEGLPEADLQVIRRGKALEYFSRHYGQVYKDQDTPMSVLEALLGINQLLDEEAGGLKEAPPHNAEPFTRMLLRLFDGVGELPRDQMQKFLRGTGSAPSDFVARGWVREEQRVFFIASPLDLARAWVGKHRKGLQSDYDQAMFLIGACFEGSGINASETLNNENFRPHPALGAILTWFKTHGAGSPIRNAATVAAQLYRSWESKNQAKVQQLSLFDALGDEVT
jgi:putative DNA methylase